jgi:hypothetical protein
VDFRATGDLSATINSGVSNSFLFSVGNGASVTIAASKASDTSPAAGLSTADIVLIRRHVLGIANITDPYKLIAADANGSATITTADISALRKLILGTTNALPGPMWTLLPSNFIFQNPLQPWNPPNYRQYYRVAGSFTGQHFVAIKAGDVDGSWTNSAGASSVPRRSTRFLGSGSQVDGPLLAVGSAKTGPNGTVSLSISVTNFTGATGLQFSIDWDPTILTYAGITGGGLPFFGSGNIGQTYTATGKLGVAWDDIDGLGVSLPDGTSLFSVNFVATGVAGTSGVNISGVPTVPEIIVGTLARTPGSVGGRVVISSPVSKPQLLARSTGNGGFELSFGHQAGVTFGIDYSTNLSGWIPVLNPRIIINGDSANWSDDGSLTGGNGPMKYYRVNAR